MKKLTVLVSLYDAGEFIENRINNLLQSTIKDDLQIVCLNANSPDERDESIPKKFSQVKYIRAPKKITVYAAWNQMIKATASPYLANANADDLVAPSCYERLIGVLDNLDPTIYYLLVHSYFPYDLDNSVLLQRTSFHM